MDIVLLIGKFLEDKVHLRADDDSFNVVENSIFSWSFANISCPTMEELLALQPEVESAQLQKQVNEEALKLLAESDWLITRELETGTPCPQEVKQARAEARAKIVHG